MLLRHVTQHVKAQNWFAVGLDFVIVVVGVFIGIEVANWNEERSARAELEEQLAGLRFEFEQNLLRMDTYQETLRQAVDDATFLRALFKGDWSSTAPDEIHARLLNVIRIPLFAPDRTALDELGDTGGLRRLSGTELRQSIAAWEEKLAYIHRLEADALKQRDYVMVPYVMQNLSWGQLMEQSRVADAVEPSKFRNDIASFAEDRELDNQIAYRQANSRLLIRLVDDLKLETERLVESLRSREGEP